MARRGTKSKGRKSRSDSKVEISSGFRRVRSLTLPLLRLMPGITVFIQPTAPFKLGQRNIKEGNGEDGKPVMGPPTLLEVIEYDEDGQSDGELKQIVCNKVFVDTLNREYPDDDYVDKILAVMRHPSDPERRKNYSTFTIEEVEAI
jgi:hypothetical protein